MTTAEDLTTIIIEQLDALPALPSAIPICVYETQHDYETLRPEDQPARVEDHTALMQLVAANLRTEYSGRICILLITLDAAAYLRYLHTNRRTNTAATRAHYIATAHNPHTP